MHSIPDLPLGALFPLVGTPLQNLPKEEASLFAPWKTTGGCRVFVNGYLFRRCFGKLKENPFGRVPS